MSFSILPTTLVEHIATFLETTTMTREDIQSSASEIHNLSLMDKHIAWACARILGISKQINAIFEIPLKTRPEFTNNSLINTIDFLKSGDCVVIHDNKTGRFFHQCLGQNLTDKETTHILKNRRVIYIDLSENPDLLKDGEWELQIRESGKQAGVKECTCNLQEKITPPSKIPYFYSFVLTP